MSDLSVRFSAAGSFAKRETKSEYVRKPQRKKRNPEVKFRRVPQDFWTRKSHYYFFVVMLGNGPDFLPYMICFALEISGGIFIITFVVSAFLLAMPLIYMENFFGRYTGLTNSQMYRMCPLFFGFGVMVFLMNLFYIPINVTHASNFFIDFLKLMIENASFKYCPNDGTDNVTCYDGLRNKLTNTSAVCNHTDYLCDRDTSMKYVVEFIHWKTYKSLAESSNPLWQVSISLLVTWSVIWTLLVLRMRVIGVFLKAITIICWVIYLIIIIMSTTVSGSYSGLEMMFSVDFDKCYLFKIIIIAFYTIAKLGFLVPGQYMTSSAYANFNKRLGTAVETILLVSLNVAIALIYMAGMFTVAGALAPQYDIDITAVMAPLSGLYLSMIPQFMVYMESPLSFILCYVFFFWFIQIIQSSVLIHLIILNIYDYLPQLSFFPNYVGVALVGVCAIASLIASMHFFVAVTEILAVNYIVLCVSAHVLIESFSAFCVYGVNRLCDDIAFTTGKQPTKYWSLLWYAIPLVSLVSFIITIIRFDTLQYVESTLLHRQIVTFEVYAGSSLLCATLLVAVATSYLFLVRNLKAHAGSFLIPQYFWGPRLRDVRIARKLFAPRTAIWSQSVRKAIQKFRVNSIKQKRQKDIAEKSLRGRVFVDSSCFIKVDLLTGRSVALTVNKSTIIYT